MEEAKKELKEGRPGMLCNVRKTRKGLLGERKAGVLYGGGGGRTERRETGILTMLER